MRTRFFSIILQIWSIWFSVGISAQTLTAELYKPLPTDSLLAYKIPYIQVTDTGRNCVWNFSDISTDTAEIIPVDYFASSASDTTRVGLHRERTNYYYHYAKDTLWLTEYETSRTHVFYTSPVPLLRYPFEYGDTLNGTFKGNGQYCHLVPLSVQGSIQTHADAMGTLKLPDMVIDSASRVHSQICYYDNSYGEDTIKENRYMWFSPHCRYPLIETIFVQAIKKADTVSFSSAYYFPQEQETAPVKRLPFQEPPSDTIDYLITNVSYLPNPVHTNLQIDYSLVHSAKVYISIHYNGGVTTYQTPVHMEEEGAHSITINMSGLPIGSYVVYIHADDTVVSGVIVKL